MNFWDEVLAGVNTAAAANGADAGVLSITLQGASAGVWGQSNNNNGTGVFGIGNNVAGFQYLTTGSGGAFNGLATGLFARVTTAQTLADSQAIYTDNMHQNHGALPPGSVEKP